MIDDMQVMQNIGDVLSLEETQVSILFDLIQTVPASNRRKQGRLGMWVLTKYY